MRQRAVAVPLERWPVELAQLDRPHVGGDEGRGELDAGRGVLQQRAGRRHLDQRRRLLGQVVLVVADVERVLVHVLGRRRRRLLLDDRDDAGPVQHQLGLFHVLLDDLDLAGRLLVGQRGRVDVVRDGDDDVVVVGV